MCSSDAQKGGSGGWRWPGRGLRCIGARAPKRHELEPRQEQSRLLLHLLH